MKSLVFICMSLFLCFTLSEGVVMCYWSSWANGRNGSARFGVEDIPTDLCTHYLYAFVGLDATGALTFLDSTTIEGKSNSVEDFVNLKESNPDLKLLAAIGGWTESSDDFTVVVNNDTLRATFVANIVTYLKSNNLDGIDIDWEYPAQRGGASTDKEAFIWLLQDLKAALQPLGLLVTAAVGVTRTNVELSYYVANMSEALDYINLMTYDLHGYPYNETGVSSPLYAQLTDDEDAELNVVDLVNLWIEEGADPAKLVLGMGNYGRSFTLPNLDDVSTGVPATGAGTAGPYTAEAGFLAYYEICISQQENEWNITEVEGSYVYGNTGTFWLGYDNENTIKAKAEYAKSLGLGGIMFWAIDLDDFFGACNTSTTFPLMKTAISAFTSA